MVELKDLFCPLQDIQQFLALIIILIRTNGSLDYDEYREILRNIFNRSFSLRVLEQAINRIELLFGYKIEKILEFIKTVNFHCDKATIKLSVNLKLCVDCNIALKPIDSFQVTCYDHHMVHNGQLERLECPKCKCIFNPTYKIKDNEKLFYAKQQTNVFIISQKTAFTKSFIFSILTLIFRNGLSFKSKSNNIQFI